MKPRDKFKEKFKLEVPWVCPNPTKKVTLNLSRVFKDYFNQCRNMYKALLSNER
jgi:hypothetical protein